MMKYIYFHLGLSNKIIVLGVLGIIGLTIIMGYIFSVFSNKNINQQIDANDLRILLREYPGIPVKRLRKVWELTDANSGFTEHWIPYSCPDISDTNSGYKIRWGPMVRPVSYYLIDGEIAWTYRFFYASNPLQTTSVFREKVDAKEFDPKYREIIKEAEIETALKMQKERVRGIHSIVVFWSWKKEYLKQKGIDWKSPWDLNENSWY